MAGRRLQSGLRAAPRWPASPAAPGWPAGGPSWPTGPGSRAARRAPGWVWRGHLRWACGVALDGPAGRTLGGACGAAPCVGLGPVLRSARPSCAAPGSGASHVPRVPCRFLLRDSRGGKVSAPRPGSGSRRPGVGPDHNGEGCGRPLIGYEQQCISRPVPDDPMFIGGYTDQGRCRAGCGAGGKASRTAGKECSLLSDLAALTPPAVVCVAFLIGVGLFLRHQLGPKRESAEDEYPEDISGDSGIPHRDGSQSDASEPAASPDRGER